MTRVRVYVQDVPNRAMHRSNLSYIPRCGPNTLTIASSSSGLLVQSRSGFICFVATGLVRSTSNSDPELRASPGTNTEKEVRDHVLKSLRRQLSACPYSGNITIDAAIVGCAKSLKHGDVIAFRQIVLCDVKVLRNCRRQMA
jgi:hypothetical protein